MTSGFSEKYIKSFCEIISFHHSTENLAEFVPGLLCLRGGRLPAPLSRSASWCSSWGYFSCFLSGQWGHHGVRAKSTKTVPWRRLSPLTSLKEALGHWGFHLGALSSESEAEGMELVELGSLTTAKCRRGRRTGLWAEEKETNGRQPAGLRLLTGHRGWLPHTASVRVSTLSSYLQGRVISPVQHLLEAFVGFSPQTLKKHLLREATWCGRKSPTCELEDLGSRSDSPNACLCPMSPSVTVGQSRLAHLGHSIVIRAE